jgi:hypothetical protein
MNRFCLECGKPLQGKQTKFCHPNCKSRWWNRKREAEVKGFEILTKAFESVRKLPADEDPHRAK